MTGTDKEKLPSVLIYGGTTEGRKLTEHLSRNGFDCTVCVATEYGEAVMEKPAGLKNAQREPMGKVTLHTGRMDAIQMAQMADAGEFLAVVDATHPFATEVSVRIRESLNHRRMPYLRLKRNTDWQTAGSGIRLFADTASCIQALYGTTGNILLTTGSKELPAFCRAGLQERLYVRVLPGKESIGLCEEQGIAGRQIIAMQGPFSREMNEAMIRQYQITCLVTKESGNNGGFGAKLEAAEYTKTAVYVIGNPERDTGGLSFEEVLDQLCNLAGRKKAETRFDIAIIGMGMGRKELLTVEAGKALQEAELVFGAERLLGQVTAEKEQYPYYRAEEILQKLREIKKTGKTEIKAAILFSGDTGFYSGAAGLYRQLEEEADQLDFTAAVFPGISAMSYLAAKIGIPYQGAAIVSIHGRKAELLRTVERNRRTFVLLSGVGDMKELGELLGRYTPGAVILAGYQLSYPEERVWRMQPEECKALEQEGLYCCFIENLRAGCRITHGRKDTAFIRGKVPMTKEEVREISICKLQLHDFAVIYDVGSGTGSVAVECALLSDQIHVYAIERNPEAAVLIRQNCEQFGTCGVELVEAEAPEGLETLPAPTHAFLGGSGGKLGQILQVLYQKNPHMRIVANAITLETLGSMLEIIREYPVDNEEIVQVQVSRSRKAGEKHLMQTENGVYIISFDFKEF